MSTVNTDGDWATASALVLLRVWWCDTDMTTSEMAIRLGCSKNAIVGKAHRMGLPEKENPCKRRDPSKLSTKPKTVAERARQAAIRNGRPPRPQGRQPTLEPIVPLPSLASLDQPPPIAKQPTFIAPPRQVERPPQHYAGKVEPCCWVTTEGGKGKPWLYCDVDSLEGRPYCGEHCARAYQRRSRMDQINVSMGAD